MRKKLVLLICALVLTGMLSQTTEAMKTQKAVTVQPDKGTKDEVKEETETVTPVEIELPIAIVNLDEGVAQSSQKKNYGADLIEAITEDIKVTGLEDARQGIETGRYSAYIIIPDTFSENVVTVDSQPVKSQLTFAMASELALTQREKVLESAIGIYNTFSNSLSKVYTSSLLKEYHESQDAAGEVMDRDQVDLEKLLEINGYDLVELIEVPELETVERDIRALDLSDNYAANSEGLSNINSAYKEYIQSGSDSLATILDQTSTVEEKKEKTGEDIQAVADDLDQISIKELNDEQRMQDEDDQISQSTDAVGEVVEDMNDYGISVEDFNKEVFNQSAKYDDTERRYRELIAALDGTRTEDQDSGGDTDPKIPILMEDGTTIEFPADQRSYSFYSISDVESKNLDYIAALQEEFARKLYNVVVNADIEFGSLIDPDTTMGEILLGEVVESESDCLAYVKDRSQVAEPAYSVQGVDATILEEDITAPQITIGEEDYTQLPTFSADPINAEIDKILAVTNKGRTDRNTEYADLVTKTKADVDDVKTKLTNVNTSYADETQSHQQLLGDLSGFNMLSYIQDDEISQFADALSANQQDISEKVLANNEDYETYTGKVYEATNTNITNLQKSISEGQEASNKKLEDTLADVKNSKENTTKENSLVLNDFTTRLSYSRLGQLENQQVYDFIAEPLLLSNVSEPISGKQKVAVGEIEKQASDVGVTQPVKDLVTTAKANKGLSWAMVAVISVIVLALTFLGALKIINSRKKEHF